ncbi:hypothetical protein JL722_10212 [Aureococcus anophagefferens]|nr:hypothetical protein JL722_10212 [Aureococcus anophagefferens]
MAPNYVRVGVRIRPPFEDEIADELAEAGRRRLAAGRVVVEREGQASCASSSGKRAFAYDYAFGPEASQADVFDAVAAPVVDAVAAGGARHAPGLGFYVEGLREYVVAPAPEAPTFAPRPRRRVAFGAAPDGPPPPQVAALRRPRS